MSSMETSQATEGCECALCQTIHHVEALRDSGVEHEDIIICLMMASSIALDPQPQPPPQLELVTGTIH